MFGSCQKEIPEMTPREAWNMLNKPHSTWRIIDVREYEELVETGTPPGALHLPLGELLARGCDLSKEAPLIVACRSGRRSCLGATRLVQNGYADVRNLTGGMIAWQEAGLPTVMLA